MIGKLLTVSIGVSVVIAVSEDADLCRAADKAIVSWKLPSTPLTVAWSPDSQVTATGHRLVKQQVALWDSNTGKRTRALDHPKIQSLAFSYDSKLVATGDQDGFVNVWEVASGNRLNSYVPSRGLDETDPTRQRYGAADAIAFAPGDKEVVIGQHAISIWNRSSGDIQVLQPTPRGPGATGGRWLSFSADRKFLFACDPYGTITLWTWPSKKERNAFETSFRQDIYAPVVMSPDASIVASTDSLILGGRGQHKSQLTLYLHDSNTGKVIKQFEKDARGRSIGSIAFSPDSKVLAYGLSDGTVRLHNLRSESVPVREFRPHKQAAWVRFSPDGSRILTAAGSNASIWPSDVGTKK